MEVSPRAITVSRKIGRITMNQRLKKQIVIAAMALGVGLTGLGVVANGYASAAEPTNGCVVSQGVDVFPDRVIGTPLPDTIDCRGAPGPGIRIFGGGGNDQIWGSDIFTEREPSGA